MNDIIENNEAKDFLLTFEDLDLEDDLTLDPQKLERISKILYKSSIKNPYVSLQKSSEKTEKRSPLQTNS